MPPQPPHAPTPSLANAAGDWSGRRWWDTGAQPAGEDNAEYAVVDAGQQLPDGAPGRYPADEPESGLILQRQLGEWVAASSVVAETGLVLAPAAPV